MDVVDNTRDGTVPPWRRVPLPDVTGPIATGPSSRPFLAAQRVMGLEAHGYVEEEYILSGSARVYDWPALGMLQSVAEGSYLTRMLVRRPADGAPFSGDVWLEVLNPTLGYDVDFMWGLSHKHFMRRGDVWVGLTVAPVALTALRAFDERRYGSLAMADPRSLSRERADSSDVHGESGLAWGIIAQLGALLRSDDPSSPLRGLDVRCIGLTGFSRSGAYVLVYMNAMAPWARTPQGEPVFDAYLPVAGSFGAVPINGSTPVPPAGDPRTRFQPPLDAPVIVISTQADFATATTWDRRTDRPADRDGRRRLRLYEVAGAGHLNGRMIQMLPPALDVIAAGREPFGGWTHRPSDFPLHYVVDAALANLAEWARNGTAPPRAARLHADHSNWPVQVEVDDLGNPFGGVRTPYVDVPIATYHARLDGDLRDVGLMIGHAIPFSGKRLRSLYPTHGDYVAKVEASVRRLLASRWLTAPDARQIVDEATARTLR
jgi:hypothetical protein